MFDFVGVIVLVALTALFGFLAVRAWGAKNKFLKWGGLALSGLLTLAVGATLVVALVGFYKLNATYPNPVADLKVEGTPEQIARGERLAQFCKECHSPNQQFPLIGRNFLAPAEGEGGEGGGPPPVGSLYAPNITPAHFKDWSDGEIVRAIREGVGKDGRALIIMPSEVFRYLSDDDVQSLVAFLRSQPAAEPDTPESQLNTLGAIMAGAGMVPFTNQSPITEPIVSPPPGTSPEYGKYLVSILYCQLCHGENLGGLAEGNGPPPGPNLTTIVPEWTEAEFAALFREGKDPEGKTLGEEMPWKLLGESMTDDDLKAMYAYLHSLPPVEGPAK